MQRQSILVPSIFHQSLSEGQWTQVVIVSKKWITLDVKHGIYSRFIVFSVGTRVAVTMKFYCQSDGPNKVVGSEEKQLSGG